MRLWDYETMRHWDHETMRPWANGPMRQWDKEITRQWDKETRRQRDNDTMIQGDNKTMRQWGNEILFRLHRSPALQSVAHLAVKFWATRKSKNVEEYWSNIFGRKFDVRFLGKLQKDIVRKKEEIRHPNSFRYMQHQNRIIWYVKKL